MKYKQLLAALQKLDAEQLDMDVTVFDSENEEAFPAVFEIAEERGDDEEDYEGSGMLESGLPYLSFTFDEEPVRPAPKPPTAEEVAAEKARIAEMLKPINMVEKSRKIQQELNNNPLLKKNPIIYSK